jgi:flavin reductase (DIM6/NTAB) family NADH-FMN oxidoreductase RutF
MRLIPKLKARFRAAPTQPAVEIDPARFRQVMSRFATGVTIITAEANGETRGMTANGFLSGSLHPPLCVVSIAKRARMHETIGAAGRFGVNMLAHGQEDVSAHFAGRTVAGLAVHFARKDGTPLLADACARIVATSIARHDCGDHSLFIGRILHMEADERPPLVVHASRYASLMYAGDHANAPSIEFW